MTPLSHQFVQANLIIHLDWVEMMTVIISLRLKCKLVLTKKHFKGENYWLVRHKCLSYKAFHTAEEPWKENNSSKIKLHKSIRKSILNFAYMGWGGYCSVKVILSI